MRHRSEGYLTVEATLALTAFLFFMMFLMNMGHIYVVQNYVTHGLLQAGKLLGFYSYEFEGFSMTETIVHTLFADGIDSSEIKSDWVDERYSAAARKAFGYCAGENTADTNAKLEEYGVSGGIAAMDFSKTQKQNGDLSVEVSYTVQLPFAFWGFEKVQLHQKVLCGLWE